MGEMGGRRVLCRVGTAMPSAGTLCQLLALGLIVETRLELAAQKHDGDTAHRVLHDDDPSFVTAAQTEAIVADHVEAAVAQMRGELDHVEAAVAKRSPAPTASCCPSRSPAAVL